MKVIKKLFLSPHLEILDDSLYLGKSPKFSILANGLAKLLEHFSKSEPNFFYFSKAIRDALILNYTKIGKEETFIV